MDWTPKTAHRDDQLMKYKEPSGIEPAAIGVIFFAQCLDELLYEYTPATYKPRVMSPSSLGEEVLKIISHVEAGSMDRSRLTPVIDELTSLLKSDSVARHLLPFPIDFYAAFNTETKLSELSLKVSLLLNVVKGEKYIAALQHHIIKLCQSDRRKAEIRIAAKDWVSSMLSLGYSKEYLFTQTQLFYGDASQVTEPGELSTFFRVFDAPAHQYKVLFKTANIIRETEESARHFKIQLLQENDPILDIAKQFDLIPGIEELVAVVHQVKAKDPFMAKKVAEQRLERLSDMFALFHHKRKIQWHPNAVSIDHEATATKVSAGISSAKRSRDNLPGKASQKLAEAMNGLSFADRESFGRFISVVRLHGSAQEATSSEAALINLWTGMEVLVPRESDSKLRAVVRLIIPFLSHGYFDRLLDSLAGDLYRWDRKGTSRLLRRVQLPDWKQHHKLAAILIGGPNEELRSALYGIVDGYALLKNRCFEISQLLSKREHLEARLSSHEQRINWQLERIYRARNMIVHDGASPKQTDALVENAHEYLDGFIDRFIDLCAKHKYAKTLDEAIEFQSELHTCWRKGLRDKAPITTDNIRDTCAFDA